MTWREELAKHIADEMSVKKLIEEKSRTNSREMHHEIKNRESEIKSELWGFSLKELDNMDIDESEEIYRKKLKCSCSFDTLLFDKVEKEYYCPKHDG